MEKAGSSQEEKRGGEDGREAREKADIARRLQHLLETEREGGVLLPCHVFLIFLPLPPSPICPLQSHSLLPHLQQHRPDLPVALLDLALSLFVVFFLAQALRLLPLICSLQISPFKSPLLSYLSFSPLSLLRNTSKNPRRVEVAKRVATHAA